MCSILARFGVLLIAVLWTTPRVLAEQILAFTQGDGRLTITVDGKPLAVYVWQDREILRPYFTQIHAPDGTQVTRNNPPLTGKDPTDHATMHPGLWLAFGDLSGADFWRNKGVVMHVEFVEQAVGGAGGGGFAVRNRYMSGERSICEEICRIRIRVQPDSYLITWDSRFTGNDSFYFGDQEEMGLGVRLATPFTANNGGRIRNSDGLTNEKQVWGKPADWCDYGGKVDDRIVGVLLMPDPQNFRRSWFHARDYGLLVANPFGQNAFTRGPASKITVAQRESQRLRFGVLIHSGPLELSAAYQDWIASLAAAD